MHPDILKLIAEEVNVKHVTYRTQQADGTWIEETYNVKE